MPPLHPAFVHFPIALVVFSFITDLLGRLFGWASLRAAGFWCLIGALIFGGIAAVTGYFDFTRDSLGAETARYADFHQDIGYILVGAVVVLTVWRWLVYARRDISPGYLYLVAALLVRVGMAARWFTRKARASPPPAKELSRPQPVSSVWTKSRRTETDKPCVS